MIGHDEQDRVGEMQAELWEESQPRAVQPEAKLKGCPEVTRTTGGDFVTFFVAVKADLYSSDLARLEGLMGKVRNAAERFYRKLAARTGCDVGSDEKAP